MDLIEVIAPKCYSSRELFVLRPPISSNFIMRSLLVRSVSHTFPSLCLSMGPVYYADIRRIFHTVSYCMRTRWIGTLYVCHANHWRYYVQKIGMYLYTYKFPCKLRYDTKFILLVLYCIYVKNKRYTKKKTLIFAGNIAMSKTLVVYRWLMFFASFRSRLRVRDNWI